MRTAIASLCPGELLARRGRLRKRGLLGRLSRVLGSVVPSRRKPFDRYRTVALASAALAGISALAAFLFDPVKGLNRRQRAAGVVRHGARRSTHWLATRFANLRNRMRGFVAERWPFRAEVASDAVLESRVRAELGHAVRHPEVKVTAHHGHVIVSGYAAAEEAERLLERAREVPGVSDVEDRIEVTPA